MTSLPKTFREYYTVTPDPNAGALGAADTAFQATETKENCFSHCDNPTFPYVFIANLKSGHKPVPVVAPFSVDAPGRADNTGHKYGLVGDLTDEGYFPAVVRLTEEEFDTKHAGSTTAPTMDTWLGLWTGVGAAATHIEAPTADTEDTAAKGLGLLPHPYVKNTLTAHLGGLLSWPWLITNVATPIMADQGQRAAYAHFLDFLRVSTTMRTKTGPHIRYPVNEIDLTAVFDVRRVVQLQRPLTVRHLLGLVAQPAPAPAPAPTTTGGQPAPQGAPALPARRTLQQDQPITHEMALKISEVPNATGLTPVWTNYNHLQKGQHQNAIEMAFANVATSNNLPRLIVGPAYATDFAGGRWLATNANAIDEGLGITRLDTEFSSPEIVRARLEQNRAFNILHQVNGTGGEAVNLALTNRGGQLPQDPAHLRVVIQAGYVVLLTFCGAATSHAKSYHDNLASQAHNIETLIRRDYPHSRLQALVCLKIVMYIHRLWNNAWAELLTGPVPTTMNPQPRPQDPPYGDIYQSLLHGRIMSLTELPPTVAAMVPAERIPPVPRQEPPRNDGNPPPDGGRNAGGSTRVDAPESQNQRLRAAWTAAGHTSLYAEGAPFHDPSQRNGKKVIMRLAGNRSQRICNPWAVKGYCYRNCSGYHGQLTDAEERLVAQEAGLQL